MTSLSAPTGFSAPTSVRPAGGRALLVTFDQLVDVIAYRAGLDDRAPLGILEVVSAARSLLVRYDPSTIDASRLSSWLRSRRPGDDASESGTGSTTGSVVSPVVGPVVEIPVVYDGDDLEEVGRLTGLGVQGVVSMHTGQTWTSAFCGFAPGFSYLVGSAPMRAIPRRDTPRTSVPSGAVALAGEFSAVYPRSSPGGWQLIGRTETAMWSLDRQPPALAPAGTPVRFTDARR